MRAARRRIRHLAPPPASASLPPTRRCGVFSRLVGAVLAALVLASCTIVSLSGPSAPPQTQPAVTAPSASQLQTSAAPRSEPPNESFAPADLSKRPLVWFAPLPPLPGRTGSTDFMDQFSTDAPSSTAAGYIDVYKLYGEWVGDASPTDLRTAIDDISRRGMVLAMEAGPLTAPANCGQGVESFPGKAAGLDLARRIRVRRRAAGRAGTRRAVLLRSRLRRPAGLPSGRRRHRRAGGRLRHCHAQLLPGDARRRHRTRSGPGHRRRSGRLAGCLPTGRRRAVRLPAPRRRLGPARLGRAGPRRAGPGSGAWRALRADLQRRHGAQPRAVGAGRRAHAWPRSRAAARH